MFIEEPALESIYRFVDSLLANLNSDMALKKKQEFQKILLIFKSDPANKTDYFQDQMLNFIQNLIKLSAIPKQSHAFNSFKNYLSNYLSNLQNIENDPKPNTDLENENEKSCNSFLLRERQKKSTKDIHKLLQELKILKSANLNYERKIKEYNQIIKQFENEIIYLSETKERIESKLADESIINQYDQMNQKEVEDLMFLIDQINAELKVDNLSST